MQHTYDWFLALDTQPGSCGARTAPGPGSRDTEFLLISPEPGRRGASDECLGERAERKKIIRISWTANQTSSHLNLAVQIHQPNKRLLQLGGLAGQSLHAWCEPSCAATKTNHAHTEWSKWDGTSNIGFIAINEAGSWNASPNLDPVRKQNWLTKIPHLTCRKKCMVRVQTYCNWLVSPRWIKYCLLWVSIL